MVGSMQSAAETIWHARLRPPPLRPGIAQRTELIDRLYGAREPRVITIVAPAGYGKTTLVALWKSRETRPVAWLSVDRSDNDPAVLLANIVAAFQEAGVISGEAAAGVRLVSGQVAARGAGRLADVLGSTRAAALLVLDQLEAVRSRASKDVIAELAARLRPPTQLVLASRTSLRLPVAVYRAQGALLELSASDLAMDREEAHALLAGSHLAGDGVVDELVGRTEGWPVGLYLVGIAANAGSPRQSPLRVGGDDRLLADYLRHEVLEHLSDARVTFLTRTSILDRFCGPLCDAVLDTTGSSGTIERLEKSNLLIVPLDRTREWYRYHHLLRDFLRSELRRREPEVVANLHVRAAKWYDENGLPDEAIPYAQQAGDADMVAGIIARTARSTYAQGRAETVFGWLRWFEQGGRATRYPPIAALGALLHALSGDEAEANRWASVLLADDTRSALALPPAERVLRAVLARDGIEQQRADARAARLGATSDPEWLAAALTLEAFSHLWEADIERADALFAQAAAAGEFLSGVPLATLALAARALIAIERGDWNAADDLVSRSLKLIDGRRLDRYVTSGLAFAVATRCAVRRGDIDDARRLLARSATIRPLLTAATPGISVQILLETCVAHVELSDLAGARTVLRDASGILARHRNLGLLVDQHDEVKRHLASFSATTVGASALTAAELRLLPFLSTHLSFPEIGDRLYVSRHTVKTQAMSIYRKLGASSRSEAVHRAAAAGLLPV